MRNSEQRKSNSESHNQKTGGRYKTYPDSRTSVRGKKHHNKILEKRILKQARKKRGPYTWKARAKLSSKLTGWIYVCVSYL